MQRQHDLGGRPRLAYRARRHRQHRPDALDAFGHGFLGAAGRLNGHGLEMVTLDQPVFVLHAVDLEHLAAEAHHQRGAQVGMRGIAPLRPLQHVPTLPARGHAAAGAVHESHHAVDAGIVGEHAGAVDLFGDELRGRGRTVHRGEHADIIARPGLAVRPHIAFEGRALIRRQQLVVPGAFGETVVAREVVQRDVLLVHPVAGRDRLGGKADDLPVFAHRLVGLDRRDRHLVAARHALTRGRAGNHGARGKRVDGDNDIVVGGKSDETRAAHQAISCSHAVRAAPD